MGKEITISDFLETKQITEQDLKTNFQFVKRIDIDMIKHIGCVNCNNKSNLYAHDSPAWTHVHHCIACNTIMITFFTDRMSGVHTDTVDVYEKRS